MPRLSFNLIYNLEAVAACLKNFMGLALAHFQKHWLLILMVLTGAAKPEFGSDFQVQPGRALRVKKRVRSGLNSGSRQTCT